MPFNETVIGLTQYSVNAYASTATTIVPGTAVKLDTLPVGIKADEIFFKVSVATSTDVFFGVVGLNKNLTDKSTQRVVMANAALMPVLLNAAGTKYDYFKVKTADGKFEKAVTGETSDVQLMESAMKGELCWARPMRVKI